MQFRIQSSLAGLIISIVLVILTVLMAYDSINNVQDFLQDVPADNSYSQEFNRIQPCVNEDGSGSTEPCIWNAHKQGNHIGQSFWIDSNGGFNYYV